MGSSWPYGYLDFHYVYRRSSKAYLMAPNLYHNTRFLRVPPGLSVKGKWEEDIA